MHPHFWLVLVSYPHKEAVYINISFVLLIQNKKNNVLSQYKTPLYIHVGILVMRSRVKAATKLFHTSGSKSAKNMYVYSYI